MKNTFSSISRIALACTLAGIAPAMAHADDAADTADRDADSILVVGQRTAALDTTQSTGSRLGLSVLETPASIAIVDGETLRARGDLSIQDAVTRAPGIVSVANPGNGGTALSARGFAGQGSVLQLIDGVRLFPVAGTITFPTDPWMADRIEVLSGPASVLYGQGALGGAINVVTRQPNTDRLRAQAEVGYGSQNSFRAGAGLGGPLGDLFSFRVDGSYRRADGYVERGKSESYALSGALRFAPSGSFSLTLRDDYGNQRPMEYFGTPLINGKLDTSIRKRNYNVADADLHYRDNRTTLTADWSPSDTLTFTNTAYRLTSRRLFKDLESYCWIGADGFCPNGYNSDPGTPGLIYRTDNLGIDHDQTQIGDQGSIKLETPIGNGVSNTLVAGFDVNLVKLTYSNDFGSDLQEDEVNPRNFNPGLFFDTQGIAPRFRTRTNEYAFFAEDRLKLNDQISLVGGLRYEHDRVRRWTLNYTGSTISSETQVLDKKLSNTTWRVGAIYQPTSNISLYGQYSTGVDPLGTLTTYSTGQVAFSNATGNQIEFGVKASFLGGRGSATLAAYRIVKNNLLAQKTLTSPIEQVGQRSAKGIEASVAIDLPEGFGIEANGTVLDAKYDDFISGGFNYNGKTPAGIAEIAGNLSLRWDPIEKLQARASLRYVGKRYSDDANLFKVPGYAVVDASLSYALIENVAIDVRVYNLFDKAYAVTTYNDEQWILGRPRSFDVALRARF
ncbi:TonB-dependent receptor [Novosphingobium sp. G106]|uniref:TonB-dependent receptor n=1 Tax=Novosphingobium sp. G106 TaxID=2849500 RepID=UPI001C2D5D44|nr:TonB-dependent receptor [Novosphingobium sp. G106]MBV1687464.1 TonB-dependent receptor [Novosphingobium sp. G106]